MSGGPPWDQARLGWTCFVSDTGKYMIHNGYEWVDFEPEDDLDVGHASTVTTEEDLP